MNDDYFRMFGNEADTKQVAAGEAIFRAGDPADCFYVVGKGSVLIHDGAREIETVGEGGIFGELALIDGAPRSATATAVGQTTVVPLDERRFQRCVMQTPYFAQAVMRVMAERLRRNGGQPGG
jgi:CRP/FNR family transcriptional regulator, cyclic AMP receptor protein